MTLRDYLDMTVETVEAWADYMREYYGDGDGDGNGQVE